MPAKRSIERIEFTASKSGKFYDIELKSAIGTRQYALWWLLYVLNFVDLDCPKDIGNGLNNELK